MIIHPLAQAGIYALVLAEVMAAKLPRMPNDKFAYAIYLLSGILAWSLFSEVVARCLTLFIDQGNLLKKIVFPRICLPLIVAGSALFNNALLLVAVVAVFAALGHLPGAQVFWVLPLTLLTLTFALSIGLFLGVINVFIRDLGQVIPVMLQLGFWFTPIVYTVDALPEAMRPWLRINPLTPLVEAYQNAMLFNVRPDVLSLGWIALLALTLLGGALVTFRRASADMVDVL
jgi:lipopolysaccharide transport system permease protein